jgi:putative metallohydrolase (TIGR04338 family)
MLDNCAASGNPLVTIDAIPLTLPPEARFARVDDVQRYVDRILASQSIIDIFGHRPPVTVRARRSAKPKAHYEPDRAVIAIPEVGPARKMLRELVVLHELAHHLDTSTGPVHGEAFLDAYLTLLEVAMAPQAALALRLVFAHHGVQTGAAAKPR